MTNIKTRTNQANTIVKNYTRAAVGVGVVPIPLLDLTLLSGIQLKMLHSLAQLYQVEFSRNLAQPALAALLGAVIPVSFSVNLSRFIKIIPAYGWAVGAAGTALFGSVSTYAVGQIFIQHFASGGTFLNFEPEQVKEYYTQQLNNDEQEEKSFAGIRP